MPAIALEDVRKRAARGDAVLLDGTTFVVEPGDRLVFSSDVLTSPVVRVCTGAPEHRAAKGG